MPATQTVLRVFLASPGDVGEERDIVDQIIAEWNDTWSRELCIRLELIRWETHAYPGFGDDAQDVINREIPQDYDIFIGIMWTRFGTPTHRDKSGTAEEFRQAFGRYTADPEAVSIMFYFKDAPVPPSQMDGAQLTAVQEFRAGLAEYGGLYWSFTELDEFSMLLRMHLSRHVQDWQRRIAADGGSRPTDTAIPNSASVVVESTIADISQFGLIDLVELAEDGIGRVNTVMVTLATALDRLTTETHARTAELAAATDEAHGITRIMMKHISTRHAADLNHYASTVEANAPIFSEATKSAFEAIAKSAMLYLDFDENGADELRNALDQIQTLRPSVAEARDTIADFRGTILGMPRVTSEQIKAQTRAVKALLVLDSAFETAQNLAAEAETAIAHALAEYNDRKEGE